ncbi:hypothetical protein Leryth_006288, partial [Lithospermum erythrorhizon]
WIITIVATPETSPNKVLWRTGITLPNVYRLISLKGIDDGCSSRILSCIDGEVIARLVMVKLSEVENKIKSIIRTLFWVVECQGLVRTLNSAGCGHDN